MMRAIARYEIDKMGFLEGLPRRENYDELSGFLPALEMHCGVMPGAILEPLNDAVRFVEFKIKAPDMPITYRNISCVMHGLTLSGITRFGLIAIEEGPTVSE